MEWGRVAILVASAEPCVMGEATAWPEGELQARLKIEEGDRAMVEFRANDAKRVGNPRPSR